MLKFWLPALCGMMCLGLGAGLIGVYGFFVDPLAEEFGVGVAIINIGPIALLLVPGIISPFIGNLSDRVPIRGLVLFGATVAMGALVAITQMSSLVTMALCFLVFAFGLTFYGPVVVNGLMVKLYPGKEARALAIAAIGISIASALLPPLMGALLSTLEWRSALLCLAIGVFLFLTVGAFLSLPPGVIESEEVVASKVSSDVFRRKEFWLVGFCVAMGLSVSVILALIYPPHFLSQGFTLAQAGWFLSFAGMSGLLGKVAVAWMGDSGHRFAKWLAIAFLLCQVVGLTLLIHAGNAQAVMLAVFFLGFGGGAFIPMHGYLNSRYFDASVMGQVIGAQMPLFMPFGLTGAPLAGYIYDRTGSYEPVLWGLICLIAAAIVLATLLPQANTPVEQSSVSAAEG